MSTLLILELPLIFIVAVLAIPATVSVLMLPYGLVLLAMGKLNGEPPLIAQAVVAPPPVVTNPRPVKTSNPATVIVGASTVLLGRHKPAKRSVHFDECVNGREFPAPFIAAGFDVSTTRDAGLGGEPDEEQLGFAYGEMRVLITHDSDFEALHKQGLEHCGVLRVPNNMTPETVINLYRAHWG